MTRGQHGQITPLRGSASILHYGPAQYAWADDGPASHPTRSDPPRRSHLINASLAITLPPQSLTVVAQDGQKRRHPDPNPR